MLAPMPPDVMKAVKSLIPHNLFASLPKLVEEIGLEVKNDYEFSLRKGIGKFNQSSSMTSKCFPAVKIFNAESKMARKNETFFLDYNLVSDGPLLIFFISLFLP